MERGRDRRYNDDRLGGETYRPSERHAHSPPRNPNYRANRSPPRRGRTPPPYTDIYAPPENRGDERPRTQTTRRRSRSPAFRGRDVGGNYRGRPRSPPPPRGYSPRRDIPIRSPPRARHFSRSPMNGGIRQRSPFLTKRGREPSPVEERRARSPPFAKRERYVSPVRERFERRGYSPPRDNGPRFPRENNYRPAAALRERTRSPVRRSEHVSRIGTPISSRRSSPQIHPDRAALAGSGTHSPPHRNPRAPLTQPSPGYRERSPPRRVQSPPVPVAMSPPRESIPYRQRSPPPPRRRESPPVRARNDFRNGSSPNTWSNAPVAATQGLSYQNGDSRGPVNGPGGPPYNGSYTRESPSGPPSAPISMSAHNRPTTGSLLTAPTRPRGGTSFSRENSRDGPYGPPQPRRGHPSHSPYHGPPPRHHNYDHRSSDGPPRAHNYDPRSSEGPPAGPRGPHPHHSNSGPPPFEARPPFRSNNSSSTTYPRTQRFHGHLAGVPAIVPGGRSAPSGMDPAAEKRLVQIEEDKKKLLEAIEEKQKAKRQGLREWDKTERESKREGLKSELAEDHLDRMTSEGTMSGAAF